MLGVAGRRSSAVHRLVRMASQMSNGHATTTTSTSPVTTVAADGGATNGQAKGEDFFEGVSLADLPKTSVFTTKLPADAAFPTPQDSHNAPRERLGPRLVKGALFTWVRPEEKEGAVLAGVGRRAMRDIGLRAGEERTEAFRQLMAGNRIEWEPRGSDSGSGSGAGSGEGSGSGEGADADAGAGVGVYPWAQCYGGWQFGSWAGQLGDGRAISLFEARNARTGTRYELQLKGAGRTPYSRFADGRAVVRSSVREFVASEALHGLGIPTTRALALTLTPNTSVRRERVEPGAIVCRFAQSWLRVGTFDIQRARGERDIIRKLCDYLFEEVFAGQTLPSSPFPDSEKKKEAAANDEPGQDENGKDTKYSELTLNRYAGLYRHICILNARTVAKWQAYGFLNGVLNTDNTSIMGLSLDFGPFAFIDNFDPSYTPNHDDHALRYSYRNQPSVILWNLVRLGESLGELLGIGDQVDDATFVKEGVKEAQVDELTARAEGIIMAAGEEYHREFLAEYKRLMAARLGLKTSPPGDFDELYSECLDMLHELELDFSHFFRRLSAIPAAELAGERQRRDKAGVFFHNEGLGAAGVSEDAARDRIARWLDKYRERVAQDWGSDDDDDGQGGEGGSDGRRLAAMKAVNPNFVARGWLLDEIIKKVQNEHDFGVLEQVMKMAEDPFREEWGGDAALEQRWCGDVPRLSRGIMCSCSS